MLYRSSKNGLMEILLRPAQTGHEEGDREKQNPAGLGSPRSRGSECKPGSSSRGLGGTRERGEEGRS